MRRLNLSKLVAVGLAIVSFAALAFGQPAMQVPSGATLQPEDIVQIQVFNQPQLTVNTPVGKDGYISAPFVGLLKAQGKTTNQLADEIAALLKVKLFLRDPIVSVTITQYRQLRASVGGAVARPGIYPIRLGDTIMTLLNQGGGPIPDSSDLRRATLRHANSNEYIPIDIYSLINRADLSQNYTLQDGDELNIPTEGNNRVLVLGAVQQPAAYPYHEPMTLADAISLAHGEIPYRTRFSQCLILRQKLGQPGQYLRIHANFTRFIRSGDMQQNLVLQAGDIIFIPQTNTPDWTVVSQVANGFFYLNEFAITAFGVR
jgi:polysaccharide export outer membrane protein